ncbi:MAG: hypothetical protein RIB84_29520 [Sneathiellaceae bacterium]
MTRDPKAGKTTVAQQERQARLAAALRQNLRRRKAPAGPEPAPPPGETPPDSSQS